MGNTTNSNTGVVMGHVNATPDPNIMATSRKDVLPPPASMFEHVRCASTGVIYRIEDGKKRPYTSVDAYVAAGKPPYRNEAQNCRKLDKIPTGAPISFIPGPSYVPNVGSVAALGSPNPIVGSVFATNPGGVTTVSAQRVDAVVGPVLGQQASMSNQTKALIGLGIIGSAGCITYFAHKSYAKKRVGFSY